MAHTGFGGAGPANPNGRPGRRDHTEPDSTEHSLDRNDSNVKIISKKLISFRSQSKGDETTARSGPEARAERGQPKDRIGALGSARGEHGVRSAEKAGINQAQSIEAVNRQGQFSTICSTVAEPL